MICASCGRAIEREGGVWRHLDGWRICDASAGTVAAPHPACLPERGQP